jgi:hypothetical protein
MTDDRVMAAQMITDHSEAEWIASQIEEAADESARFACVSRAPVSVMTTN